MFPQTHLFQQAFDRLDFAMAVDYFYRPQTHAHVDLLLPAAMCYERHAPFAVFGRRLFARSPIEPAGEAREDWRIALEIGARLGDPADYFNGDVEAALDSLLEPLGVSLEQLRASQEEGVTVPGGHPRPPRAYETGALRADGKPGFATPSGKIEATSAAMTRHGYSSLPVYVAPAEPTAEYPLRMITGTRPPQIIHSKWRSDSPWLFELGNQPELSIHPDDAERRGLASGDPVDIWSACGRISAVASITVETPPGVVGMMHGWASANVNELVPRDFDPVSGFPPFKDLLCQVALSQVTPYQVARSIPEVAR
jgi:anaerobic selenocysteine-containing dehydrogenase